MTDVPSGRRWLYPLGNAKAEAIELLAEGLSNDEIAKRMDRKRSTIDMFVSWGMRQLGLDTRAELVDWIVKHRPRSPTP